MALFCTTLVAIGLLAPVRPWAHATVARGRSGGVVAAATAADREKLISTLARLESAVEQTIVKLAELDEERSPARNFCDIDEVMAPRGYLSKTAGCYLTVQAAGGSTGPPPSAMTLATSNFWRELKELTAMLVPYKTRMSLEEPNIYAAQLDKLRLDNDKVWAREEALTVSAVPAPLVIKLPYLATCDLLDKLYDGNDGKRVLAKFWFLETIARVPYFGYNTMIFLYETMGWWRLSSSLKKVHFKEDENEFAHLLIVEALGGDQQWFDRFIGQHAALIYYALITFMWLISPTLAYNFSELIETHAVVTYTEFAEANEAILRKLPPPAVALDYYGPVSERGKNGGAPVRNLYDVFCLMRDDEGNHVESMKACQDPDVRSRARIVEVGAIATALAIFGASILTVETVEMEIPVVQQFELRVEKEIAAEIGKVEKEIAVEVGTVGKEVVAEVGKVGKEIGKEEAMLEKLVEKEETDLGKWWTRQRSQEQGRPSPFP